MRLLHMVSLPLIFFGGGLGVCEPLQISGVVHSVHQPCNPNPKPGDPSAGNSAVGFMCAVARLRGCSALVLKHYTDTH